MQLREAAEQERDAASQRVAETQAELADLRELLDENENARREDATILSDEIESREAAQSERDQATKQAKAAEAELSDLQQRLASYENAQQSETERRTKDQIEGEQIAAERDAALKQVEALEEDLQSRQEELQSLEAQLGERTKQIDHDADAHNLLQSERDELQCKLDETQKLLTSGNDDIEHVRTEFSSKLEDALGRATEAESQVLALQNELHAAQDAHQVQSKEHQSGSVDIDAAIAQRDDAIKRAEMAETELEARNNESENSQQHIEDLKEELEDERDQALLRAAKAEQELVTLKAAQKAKSAATKGRSKTGNKTGSKPASEEEEARMMALRNATDKPVIVNRKKKKAPVEIPQDNGPADGESPKNGTPPPRSKKDRKEKRSGSNMRASVTFEGSTHVRPCYVHDKSSSGAKLEIIPSRLSDSIDNVAVGDKLSLAFSSAQEHTSVECKVMWTADGYCGVRYLGQFRTQIIKQQKAAEPNDGEGKKAVGAKAAPRGFGRAGNTRRIG